MMAVSKWLVKWGRRVHQYPRLWRSLSKIETLILQPQLEQIEIIKPIYICGLARSGSTILLEILNRHKDTHSYCYDDFPFVHLPWFWSIKRKMTPVIDNLIERAHKDRIFISGQSPEALEELIWMNFYPELHAEHSNHLMESELKTEFCQYYVANIKKLLYAHQASRYLSKGNYNVGRIKALLQLLPDAKFIIPIRSPIEHVASLVKQHDLFVKAGLKDALVANHLMQMGHFEFGPNRIASNFTQTRNGSNVETDIDIYAKQWSMIYGYVASLLKDKEFSSSLYLIRYEDLCCNTSTGLQKLIDFCQLDDASLIIKQYKDKLTLPAYYKISFAQKERDRIKHHTQNVAAYYGY